MTARMRAARLYAPGDLRIEEVDVPEVHGDRVLVAVKAVGVCGSDPARVMKNGTYSYPTTIGHEFSGQVARVGEEVKSFKPGDRVTIVPLIPCGHCEYCSVGEYNLCDGYSYYGSRVDGAMAEYIAVEESNLLRLPDQVDFESGACTDPVSVALHALRQARMEVGNSVAVLGVGPIGLLAVQWAKIMGAKEVFAIDVFEEKLAMAKEVGADYVMNARQGDPVAFVMEMTGRAGVDRVIEMAGAKITQEQSLRMVKKQGIVVFCGISYDDLVIPKAALDGLLRKEIILVGAWNSSFKPLPIHEWRISLQFMADKRIRCHPIISHRFPIADAPEVFRRIWSKKEFFSKILFTP